jgi:hypothetical protein
MAASVVTSGDAAESQWAYPGKSQRLLYAATPVGDRIPDFSMVGYEYGRVDIPDVMQIDFVEPGLGDDTERIQDAIDRVSRLPIGDDGFRGAVVLGAGEFQIESSLSIRSSGVVLRGTGNDRNQGTVLRATGTDDRAIINVFRGGSPTSGSKRLIADKYVPVGATSFRLESTRGYSIGDRIIVHRPSTAEWVSELGMDRIPPRSDGGTVTQWTPGSRDQNSDRRIVHMEGDRIFLDAPLTHSLDTRFGGGSVSRYLFGSRINHIGIENLWGVSDYDTTNRTDEAHAWTFIEINAAEHVFVRDVTAQHFAKNAVSIGRYGKNVTVSQSSFVDPVSQVAGGRRYSFEVDGEMNLVRDSRSDSSRHDFIFNSPSPGPNVFLDSTATNSLSDTGPHQRYSTGGLFDNVTVQGNNINVRNRGNFGTGHGWAGANMVIWNSEADGFIVQSPPLAQNWLIGSVGDIVEDRRFGVQPPGIVDNHGEPVDTLSLYKKQLADAAQFVGGGFREYLLGDYDRYEFDGVGSVDETQTPIEVLNSAPWDVSALGVVGFDQAENDGNQIVPISFEFLLASDEQPFHGVITLALSTVSADRDDAIWLAETQETILLSEFGDVPRLDPEQVIVLEFYGEGMASFDDGDFHLVVGDSTQVDWARLDLTVGSRIIGDSNYDGRFNTSDLVTVFQAAEYEDEIVGNSSWSTGDWNRDTEFSSTDLVVAFQAATFESETVQTVPEPSATWLCALLGCILLNRHRLFAVQPPGDDPH